MTRRSSAEILLLLVAPVVAFWLMHFKPIAQNGFIDPYVYTGYIHNFVDLFNRYGVTYYGVRFGLILPAQIATALFGPISGYFVLRYVFALLAGLPFYLLVKQRYGVYTAAISYSLLLTSPFLARTVLWDHPDAAGVPFLFAAITLFSIEHERHRRILDVSAGLCAGMAIHSNVFAAAPLSIYFASYAGVWLWRGGSRSQLLRRVLIIVGGVAAVSACGTAYYWWRIGRADIFTITLNTSFGLVGGGMENWRTPGIAWLAGQWWALTPTVLTVLMIMVLLPRRASFHEAAVSLCLMGTTLFYAIFQFALHADFLELFYYFSYTLPIVFLSLASILGCLWSGYSRRTVAISAFLLIVAATAPWILRSHDIVLPPRSFGHYVTSVAVVLAMVAAFAWIRRPALSALASLVLGLAFYSSFAVPGGDHAGLVIRPSRPNPELDVYRVALEMIRSIPPMSVSTGTLRFWYDNGPRSLQSLQSTYLWGVSKVQGTDPDRGLPYLGTPELARILAPGVKWLGLLAEQESKLPMARAALLEHGIGARTVVQRALRSGEYTAYLEVVEIARVAPSGVVFGLPAIEVTDPTTLQVNVYGSRAGRVTTENNTLTFRPGDERDHLVSPFVEISPRARDSWARVVVDWPAETMPSCELIVQDQAFNSLETSACSSATRYVPVPATTQKIRIILTDPNRTAFRLPRRIEVTLAN